MRRRGSANSIASLALHPLWLKAILEEPTCIVLRSLTPLLHRENVAESLATYITFMSKSSADLPLLQAIIRAEIAHTKNAFSLFRETTALSLLLSTYCHAVGKQWYCSVLRTPMLPLERGAISSFTPQAVVDLATVFAQALQTHIDSVPQVIKTIGELIVLASDAKFPNNRYTSLGGFFFLRFFCPLIASPQRYGIISSSIELPIATSRLLTSISKLFLMGGVGGRFDAPTPGQDASGADTPPIGASLDSSTTSAGETTKENGTEEDTTATSLGTSVGTQATTDMACSMGDMGTSLGASQGETVGASLSPDDDDDDDDTDDDEYDEEADDDEDEDDELLRLLLLPGIVASGAEALGSAAAAAAAAAAANATATITATTCTSVESTATTATTVSTSNDAASECLSDGDDDDTDDEYDEEFAIEEERLQEVSLAALQKMAAGTVGRTVSCQAPTAHRTRSLATTESDTALPPLNLPPPSPTTRPRSASDSPRPEDAIPPGTPRAHTPVTPRIAGHHHHHHHSHQHQHSARGSNTVSPRLAGLGVTPRTLGHALGGHSRIRRNTEVPLTQNEQFNDWLEMSEPAILTLLDQLLIDSQSFSVSVSTTTTAAALVEMVMRLLTPRGASPAEMAKVKELYSGRYVILVNTLDRERTILHDEDLVWDGSIETRFHIDLLPLTAEEAAEWYAIRREKETIHSIVRVKVQDFGAQAVSVTSHMTCLECIELVLRSICQDKLGSVTPEHLTTIKATYGKYWLFVESANRLLLPNELALLFKPGSSIPLGLSFQEMSEFTERKISRLLVRSENALSKTKGIIRIEMQDCEIAGTFRTLTVLQSSTPFEIMQLLLQKILKERRSADSLAFHRATMVEFAGHWLFYSNSEGTDAGGGGALPLSGTTATAVAIAAHNDRRRSTRSISKSKLVLKQRWVALGDTVWDGTVEPELTLRRPDADEHAEIAAHIAQFLEKNRQELSHTDVELSRKAYAFSFGYLEPQEQAAHTTAAAVLYQCLYSQQGDILRIADDIIKDMPPSDKALAEKAIAAFSNLMQEIGDISGTLATRLSTTKRKSDSGSSMGARIVKHLRRKASGSGLA